MTQSELINYFKQKKYASKELKIFLEQHLDKKQFFEQQYEKHKDRFTFYVFVKYYYFGLHQKKCLQCGKHLNYKQIKSNFNYCSYKCCNSNAEKIQKTKKTNLERYGVQSSAQSELVLQKIRKTNLQKYGCQYPTQNKQIFAKIRQTNLQKYGVEIVSQNNQIKNKIAQSNLQKYGYQFPLHNVEIRNIRTINQKKQFILNFCDKIKNYIIPMFDFEQYDGYNNNQQYKWKCVKCGNVFLSSIRTTDHLKENRYIPRCLNCYPYIENCFKSNLENELFCYISQLLNLQVKQNYRDVIYPQELDIYIPQKSVAIQFNGLYWHSDEKKRRGYHLNKTQKCLQKGIQLIHIFEDQWLYKQQIVKDRIKNILGIYNSRIFARKCIIKEIDSKICNQFLQVNHIQGRDHSKIRLGLFYNEELISVMTFGKPRFNNNYEYQLIRFASKLGTQVIGGAGKLLKYFEKNYNPKNIISYADRRYSNGKLYYALNFAFLSHSEPNYSWCKGFTKFSRYQCQKHKLKKLLGQDKFNLQLSESQNMYFNGYNKIYDCGNMVFVKEIG